MSSYVKKVHFKLHESYANPLRGKETVEIKFNCIGQMFELNPLTFAISVPVHNDTGKF